MDNRHHHELYVLPSIIGYMARDTKFSSVTVYSSQQDWGQDFESFDGQGVNT